jgi:hypothetical protein
VSGAWRRACEAASRALESASRMMPERHFGRGPEPDDDVYLRRFTVFHVGFLKMYVHKFERSDEDKQLHSHPWAFAISLILKGGYEEERREGNDVKKRVLYPGSFNFLSSDTYHRVDLLEKDCWTVILCGPKTQTWYFWDRDSLEAWRHTEHTERMKTLAAADKIGRPVAFLTGGFVEVLRRVSVELSDANFRALMMGDWTKMTKTGQDLVVLAVSERLWPALSRAFRHKASLHGMR